MNTTIKQILALGDSYTVGERVRPGERWVTLVADQLRESGLKVAAPRVIAKTTWTTEELRHQLELARPDCTYDVVTLMIGVNNQFRGRDTKEFEQEACDLIEQAIGFARGNSQHLIVISIPDWGFTPFAKDRDSEAIAKEIDDFNRLLKQASQKANSRFVDVTAVSRQSSSLDGWLADDGLHPGPDMHKAWAAKISPTAISVLQETTP